MSYRRKMKRVDISVEAGKVKAEDLVVAIQVSEEKEPPWKIYLILKLPRLMGKQSPCLEFFMVNHINKLMQLFWIPKGIHTVMMVTIYTLPTLEIRVQQYQR